LRKLEERFRGKVAVVGVHSGKYTTERRTDRIRDASLRLGVEHAIVNDRQFRVWRSYAVNAWPTIVVIDPAGYVIGQHAGEFTCEEIEPFLQRVLREAESNGSLRSHGEHDSPDAPTFQPGQLRYPGKVALSDDGRLAIADSGHQRVLIGRLTQDGLGLELQQPVGGERGFADGGAHEAHFDYPQGLVFGGDRLFVADAGNHAIRAIDIESGNVATIAGTGRPLRSTADLRDGALSSPWDLALSGDRLFVAMAGIHQIWSLGTSGGALHVHSGNRREDISDGPNLEAALAQPMGIASDASSRRLYFVDAESSAVRWAGIDPGGRVGTLVGTGLFDFGDRDGVGDFVLMQHQQAITVAEDGRLLVADSYNDALKWLDPGTRRAETWLRGFQEPSGLAMNARRVYVADTNAHRVAVVDRATGDVRTLGLTGGD
jgi:DNA-binding beta-propeller fold protein YncE